jgi:hypothetical protein
MVAVAGHSGLQVRVAVPIPRKSEDGRCGEHCTKGHANHERCMPAFVPFKLGGSRIAFLGWAMTCIGTGRRRFLVAAMH